MGRPAPGRAQPVPAAAGDAGVPAVRARHAGLRRPRPADRRGRPGAGRAPPGQPGADRGVRVMAELQLRKESNEDTLHSGGKVTYRVYDGDRWIGWVGDGRKWQGHRYGAQKWWACWREDGDTAARWSTGPRFAKRQDAVDGLTARIA